jgi:hypothetical protein
MLTEDLKQFGWHTARHLNGAPMLFHPTQRLAILKESSGMNLYLIENQEMEEYVAFGKMTLLETISAVCCMMTAYRYETLTAPKQH